MSAEFLVGQVLEGLWLAMLLLVPLIVAAALAAMFAGALLSWFGVSEGFVARATKSLVVIGALALGMGWVGGQLKSFAGESWVAMSQLGPSATPGAGASAP